MLRFRFLFIVLSITMACSFSPLYPASAQDSSQENVEDEAQETPESSYLLNIFETQYMEIIDRVHQGQLPATVSEEASQIRMELKKFVINRNAELEILKLEVLEGSKQDSKAALEQMNNLVADTERTKMNYIQRLSALSPGTGTDHVAMMPSQSTQPSAFQKSSAARKKSVKKPAKETIWETKDLNRRMQISPEDLSMGRIQ